MREAEQEVQLKNRFPFTESFAKSSNQNTKICIYEVVCECGQKYIGGTGRPLDSRLKDIKTTPNEEVT